jgi:hypothetical protein
MVLLKFGWKKSTPSCFTSSTKLRWFLELVTHYIYLFITYVCIGFMLSPYYSIYSILSHHRNHVPHHYQPSASTKRGHESSQIAILYIDTRSWEWSTSRRRAAWKFHLLIWWCSDGKCTMFLFRSSTHHPHSWRCLVQCGESLSPLIAPAAAIWLLSRAISRQRQLISIAICPCRCFHQSLTPQEDGETLIFNASNCVDLDDDKPAGPHMMRVMWFNNMHLASGLTIWLPTSPRFATRRRGALQCKHTTINMLTTWLDRFIAQNNLNHKKRTRSFHQFVRQKGSGNIGGTSTTISLTSRQMPREVVITKQFECIS